MVLTSSRPLAISPPCPIASLNDFAGWCSWESFRLSSSATSWRSERRSTNSRPASAPRSLPCREASTPVPSPKASSPILADSDCLAPGRAHGAPTLYAFGFLSEPERDLVASRLRDRYGLHPAAITWTKAANQGAILACADEGE